MTRLRSLRQIGPVLDRLRPAATVGMLLTAQLSVLVVLGVAFESVIDGVTEQPPEGDELTRIDAPVSTAVTAARQPWLSQFFEVFTWAGSVAVLVPLIVVVGLGVRRSTRSWWPLAFPATCLVGAVTVSTLVKLVVARPRPPAVLALVDAAGYAFPSGHSTAAMAGWLSLAVVLAGRTSRLHRKVALITSALLIAGLVGLSRVYLGVHEPTDVLGGWSLGALWVLAVLVVVRLRRVVPRNTRRSADPGTPPGGGGTGAPRGQDGAQWKGVRPWRAGSSGSIAAARSPTSSPGDRTDPWSPGN